MHARSTGPISIVTRNARLAGDLVVPYRARALVAFAHGSGSSRASPRNRLVAERLQRERLATLLFDLLTPAEATNDPDLRFDIYLLAQRLVAVTDCVLNDAEIGAREIGYFGASTGAAAALIAAAERRDCVNAVVSRGGRPDLAEASLARVRAPTLLVVGALDTTVLRLNREAMQRMRAPATLEIVPGATHLFEEPGALEHVADLAAGWFVGHLADPHLRTAHPRS